MLQNNHKEKGLRNEAFFYDQDFGQLFAKISVIIRDYEFVMKKLVFLIVLLNASLGLAQKLKVDAMNKTHEKFRDSHHFDYIHDDYDTSKLIWIADLTVTFDTIIPGMLGESYNLLKSRANKFGANAFRVKESNIFDTGPDKFISISTFWLHMEDRDSNEVLFHAPEVYLFGFLGYHEEIDGYEVSINKKDYTMHALTFRKESFSDNERIDLQLGSKARGTSVEFEVSEKKEPRYYYFSMVRGSFKNAMIKQYDRDFAMFLTQVLQEE